MTRAKIGGGVAGLAVTLAAVSFGGYLSHRHRRRDEDDAPEYTRRSPAGKLSQVGRTVTIRKPRSELFAFWRDFSNLSDFMENLESVRPADDGNWLWVIKAPAGNAVEVVTTIASEEQDKHIAWRSIERTDVVTHGEVRFEDAPGERGTRVSLIMSYDPPGGAIGRSIAKLFLREPAVQARHDLKRFKMLMETGEIATSVRTRDATRSATQENK